MNLLSPSRRLIVTATVVGLLAFLCTWGPILPAEEDFSDELPRIPATEPAEALKTFHVADGFKIEQVAAEPLVTSPVAVEWDAQGRMYVCEMRGYSEDREAGISRITRLEDTDGDGVYDSSDVYVDGLLWPTALFPFDDGLFVGDAPNLYYFKDTDGDGKADKQTIVLTGFGTSNVQGLMNSFRWGLDSRIHVACSSTGGLIRRPDEEQSKAVNVRGRDLAFDPRSGDFVLTSGGAQHGMCFDDWGRKFVSSNSNHIQQVMYQDRYIARNPHLRAPPSRISIAADGPQAEVYRSSPVEPWRIVRTRLRVGGLVPGPVEGGGRAAGYFTGATGITIYRGDAWPADAKGGAIIGDVGSNLIHRKELEADGLQFVARRIDEKSEFVTSDDIWFRPAQFANAPDGSLHVIDVCREVIEHPKSLPPEIKRHLDLTAGRDRGRIYRIVPDGYSHRRTLNLRAASVDELVQLLQHPNAWQRETASRLLFQRQDPSAEAPLRELIRQSKSPLGRLHAMYALAGLETLDTKVIRRCLDDEHPQVRRHAVLLSERLVGSPDEDEASVSQPQKLRQPEWIRRVTELANDDSIEVRYQVAFSLGSIPAAKRLEALRDIIRRDADNIWIQAAVQSSLREGAGKLFAMLMDDPAFLRAAGAGDFLERLASQISRQDRGDDIRMAVESIEQLDDFDADLLLPVIGKLREADSNASQMVKLDRIVEHLIAGSIRTASNDSLETSSRVNAVKTLPFGRLEDVESTLLSLIDSRQPSQVQQAAIVALGEFNSPRVAPPLLAAWRQLSPQLREAASDVLFTRADRTLALFDAIDSGSLSMADINKNKLQIATKSKNTEIKSRAQKYLAAAGSVRRGDVVQSYQSSLQLAGDVTRGRQLFRKHCAVCHKVEGFGHEMGPNLATMKARGPETILVNVLDPNREVNPQYLNYIALTVDGRTMTGMIAAENATSITLRRAESASDTILRGDIEQLQSTGMSIMPEGMEELIDQQGMADIITYLMQVSG